jgi:hypothetical protein
MPRLFRSILGLVLVLSPMVAQAGGTIQPKADEGDDLWNLLENLPPRRSDDLAVGVSFANIPYFHTDQGPWVGFNLRYTYGWHLGETRLTRVGMGLGAAIEGPAPEYFQVAIEPQATVDHIIAHHFLLGASLGPSAVISMHYGLHDQDRALGITPSGAVRIGWSQAWSRVQRRMFVVAEPRLRVIAGRPNWVASVQVGSGHGW